MLPAKVTRELRRIARLADGRGSRAFIVGGMVRDIVMGYPCTDVDVTIEGDAGSVARDYAAAIGGVVRGVTGFGTCKVEGGPLGAVDFAATRTETYRRPGALPEVKILPDIIMDLERRDFAVNAMAVLLSARGYGCIIDPFGGWEDIEKRQLAVIHPESFIDDPTRVLRGVRFAARYGFRFEKHTRRFLRGCVRSGCMRTISGKRVKREIDLIFSEEKAASGIRLLERYGILKGIDRDLDLGRVKRRLLPAADRAQRQFRKWTGPDEFDTRLFWFGYLYLGLNSAAATRLTSGFNLDRRFKRISLWVSRDLGSTRHKVSRLRPPYAYKVTRLVRNLELESLALLYASAGRRERSVVKTYVTRWRHVKPSLSGSDLAELGMKQGPAMGKLLERIHELKLLGELPTRRAELSFAKRNLGVRS